MDKNKISILFVVLLITNNLLAQVYHQMSFDKDSLRMSRMIGKDGSMYVVLDYKDYVENDKPGMPSLPCKYIQFLVPDGAKRFVIEMNTTESSYTYLSAKLNPVQPPITTSEMNPPFVYPNSSVYNSFAPYPSEMVSIVQDGYYDGNKRILTVKVVPFQFIGSYNRLTTYTKLDFTIKPDNSSIITSGISSIRPAVAQSSEDMKMQLDFVENKRNISAILQQIAASAGSSPILSSTAKCEYLIVTSAPYVNSAKDLAFWKKLKGLSADVVTIESILSDPSITGDLVSGIYDDAGKLRQYLRKCYEDRGTKFVLLVGKDVPYRYATEYDIPSDLYFCDLNGNWDVDKDMIYGEETDDHVDYAPELYVGRILCKNDQEFNNYLYKLYCYEKNPGRGNSEYLKKAFYLEADQNQSFGLAQGVSGNMTLSLGFTTSQTFNERPNSNDISPTFPTGKNVIDEINKGYGFVYIAAHGKPGDITVLSAGYGDKGEYPWFDCIKPYKAWPSNHSRQSPGNSVDFLTNFVSPNVVYTHSCSTMPFDKYIYSDLIYNMGEAFTVAGRYGAVAYLGCTRNIGIPDSDIMAISFANTLKQVSNRVGMADALSKIGHYSPDRALAHNLLGCPEFRIWGRIPTAFTNVSVSKAAIINPIYKNNIQVSLGSATKCQANVVGLFGGNTYLKQENPSIMVSDFIFYNVPQNYVVSLTSEDKYPYVAPLYLQNEEVGGKHRICHVNSVSIGSNVSNQKSSGDFIVESGAEIFIQATGNVLLDCGFEVKQGASFEISNTN